MPSSKPPATSRSSSVSIRGVSFWRTDTRLDVRGPKFLRDNGLAIAAFALFFVSWGVQAYMGHQVYNEDRQVHHHALVGFWAYLRTWHFLEATMENWESEFLQMGVFVVLTSCLVQKGSAESKDPDEEPEPSSGSWIRDHSLSIFLFSMFLISFALHAVGGWGTYNEQQRDEGQAVVSLLGFMVTPTFWFQSTQNWESEFLSVGVLILATIFLRERGSPQSKKLDDPDGKTGN